MTWFSCLTSTFSSAVPRANQQVVGRTASCRLTPRRSERIAPSETPQSSAVQETYLPVQTPEAGVNASPLALIEKQAGPLASPESNPPPSRGRRKTKENPCMTMFPAFQQFAKPETTGIPTRFLSIANVQEIASMLRTRFFCWREPFTQAPNLLKQPDSW